MLLIASVLPWIAYALRLSSGPQAVPYKVFHSSDTPNFEALLLSAFRGPASKKLPEPFQSGIERIDLRKAVQLRDGRRNETDVLPPSGSSAPVANDTSSQDDSVQGLKSNTNDTLITAGSQTVDNRHWWQRILALLPSGHNHTSPSQAPSFSMVNMMMVPPEEGVWDELDDLAVKSGLVHSSSRPFAFQYDIPHGSDQKLDYELWVDTLNHSVLATAHGPDFPIVLALISLCGGSMMVTLITLLSSPFGKFGDIIRIMNITLYGVLGALLAMYFKSGQLLTAILTVIFALFPTLLATKRLPSILTHITGGLGRFIDVETFLAVRLSVTIFSSLCVQALLSISLLIFGSDRLTEHIARHLASSQILFALLITLVATSTLLPMILKLRRIERDKEGMPLRGSDFAHLNTFIHVIVSLAFGVVVIGTVSHLHNYLVFTTHKGEIMLFDPLVFFVPFSTSLFRWYNLLGLLGVWVTAGFVFLATADKAWVLQLDNSFSIENEFIDGSLREEMIDRNEEEMDEDLLLIEPTPKIVPPPDAFLIPPSPPGEHEKFITPPSP